MRQRNQADTDWMQIPSCLHGLAQPIPGTREMSVDADGTGGRTLKQITALLKSDGLTYDGREGGFSWYVSPMPGMFVVGVRTVDGEVRVMVEQ